MLKNIVFQGPSSIIVGILLGSIWGGMAAVIPEKGDTYLVPLRFLWLFLGALFALFVSNNIGWSGAGTYFVLLQYITKYIEVMNTSNAPFELGSPSKILYKGFHFCQPLKKYNNSVQ